MPTEQQPGILPNDIPIQPFMEEIYEVKKKRSVRSPTSARYVLFILDVSGSTRTVSTTVRHVIAQMAELLCDNTKNSNDYIQ